MSANKWKFKTLRLGDLKVAENNPRMIENRNFNGLINSIRRFGLVEPIVWNERTSRIVGGHQRFRALVEMGVIEATVIVVDLTLEEEMAANLTLNNPTIEGDFDEPIGDLLKHLESESKDMFKELRFDSLTKDLEKQENRLSGCIEASEDDVKATCPCCKHKWEITINDVKVDRGES